MRVFLDECVPIPLGRLLSKFDVSSAKSMGWQEVQNGALLKLVVKEFRVFVTADQNLEYQQNLTGHNLAVIVLSTNNFRRLKSDIDSVAKAIANAKVGEVTRVVIS